MSSSTVEALSEQNQSRMAAILESCLFALEHGESFQPETLLAENPDLAEPLGRCLTTLMSLHAAVHGDDTVPGNELPELGSQLGEFQIEELIGRGGMGSVYRASQPSLSRCVALKVLANTRLLAPTQLKRFQLEARAVAQLQHPNIVPIYSVGHEGDLHYYAMQLIDGQSLEKLGAEVWNQSGYRQLLDCAIDLCDALDHVHAVGIIHRDIKPSNLLLDKQGKIWITDFGLAQSRHDTKLTITGDLVGTMNYMSPEQALGKPIDERTDVYSLGVTLYEMVTGQQAFGGEVRAMVLRAIEEFDPIAPRKLNANIPYDLETIVLKAISKDREQRYSSAQDMQIDLMRVREGQPILGKRPTLVQSSWRWIKRHHLPVAIAAAGLATTSLAIVIGAASVLLTRQQLNVTRHESQQNLRASEENYWHGRHLVEHWNRDIITQLVDIPGADAVRAEMLADTVEYYRAYIQDRLSSTPDDPRLAHDLIEARQGLAVALEQSGQLKPAIDVYQQVAGQLRSQSESTSAPLRLATLENDLAVVMIRDGQVAAALEQLKATLDRLTQAKSITTDQPSSLRAAVLVNLARAYQMSGQVDEEAQALDQAETLYRQLVQSLDSQPAGTGQPGSSDQRWHYYSELATILDQRALRNAEADIERALQLSGEAIELHQRCCQSDKPEVSWLVRLAASQHNRGVLQQRVGHTKAAEENLLAAIATKQELVNRIGPRWSLNSDLARSYTAVGQLARLRSDWELAAQAFRQAQNCLHAASAGGQNDEHLLTLADTLVNLWEVENNLGSNAGSELDSQLTPILSELKAMQLGQVDRMLVTKLQTRYGKLKAGNRQRSELTPTGYEAVSSTAEATQ